MDGAHGVIVARDDIVDAVRRAVGVDDGDDRNPELVGFVDRNLLVADIDHEQHIRQPLHVLDATQAAPELVHLATQHGAFFLAALVERTVGLHLGEVGETLDRLAHRLEVGEHAAEPALIDERHAGADGFLLDGLTRRTLGADEQHGAAIGSDVLDEVRSFRVERLRLLEVDDMDLVALAEDVLGHLGVPEAGLVSEVDARLQHLSHGHAGHRRGLLVGLGLRTSSIAIPLPKEQNTQRPMKRCACGLVVVAKNGRALYHAEAVKTTLYGLPVRPRSRPTPLDALAQPYANHPEVPGRSAENA